MLIESIKNADADMKKRALLEAVNEANNVILAAEKFLKQNQEILSKTEYDQVVLLNKALQSSVQSGNKDEIEMAMKVLNDYSSPLAHRSLDVNIQKALKGVKM